MSSMPENNDGAGRLTCIAGNVPLPGSVEQGCRFYERCGKKQTLCRQQEPPLTETAEKHAVRCWLPA
jgi:peptide/nickel transport system ATP-binding protein